MPLIKENLNNDSIVPEEINLPVAPPSEGVPEPEDTLDFSDRSNQDSQLPEDTLSADPQRQTGSAVILDTKVDYSAVDSIPFDIENQIIHLYGDADLKYGSIHLTAAYININFKKNELYATGMPDSTGTIIGNPIFEDGEENFESIEIKYNFETKKGRTTRVMTEEAEGYMHGDVVKMMPDKEIHVSSGKFTTCDNPDPHFHIAFRKAKIIPNDKIITSIAFLTIEGVKTPLFVPFGFFPNKRGQASGILMPSYGETTNRGFYLENGGFYWGINDYLDLSLTGDIYSRGSWAARVGSNYRKRYRYSGSLNLNYAINILGERDLPGYERNRDFRVQWSHSQDPKARPNSVFRANVNAGSSSFNRFNSTNTNDYLSNTFSSNISYSANWANRYNLSVNLRHNQNTITEKVDLSLPEMTFSVSRFYPLRRKNPEGKLRWYEEITMNYNMNASNQISTIEEDLFTNAMFRDMKNGIQHSIPISHNFRVLNHFNLSNSVNYNERWYFQKVEQRWESDPEDGETEPGDNIPGEVVRDTIPGFYAVRDFNYSTSLNTKIFGLAQFKRGPVKALRHVITPNLSFSYRPDFADDFWGYYGSYQNPNLDEPTEYSLFEGARYGTPTSGRSGSINFSVSNNLEMKVKSKKDTVNGERKIALIDNLTLSTGYDLARDSLNMRDVRISGRTRLFGQFDLTYSSSWTPYVIDSTTNRPINTFLWEKEKTLLKMRNSSWNINLNYSLSSDDNPASGSAGRGGPGQGDDNMMQGGDLPFGSDEETDPGADDQQEETPTEQPENGIDLAIPWSFRLSYSFNYNANSNFRTMETDRKYLQSLNFSGDVNLTPNWRIGVSSGYDFDEKKITYTSVDIYRDLHCWELTINWIPFGFRKSYNMTLRVKSTVLQDLKLTRRTHHLDRAFQ
ncbi:MAG: putative LPS assembly protein LptD [Bacteroidota bacterium]